MTRPLLAFSNLIIDHIVEADGTSRAPMLGGAGLYAAAAMRMWWPHVALVAGVGKNLTTFANREFLSYDFDPQGFVVRDNHCIESRLVYLPDGSRTESPTFGQDHFERLQLGIPDIAAELLPAAGCYIFMGTDPTFWNDVGRHRTHLGLLMWELDSVDARPDKLDEIASIAPLVDVLSLNIAEASSLLGAPLEPTGVLMKLDQLGFRRCILRLGAEGALASFDGRHAAISPPPSAVVDVTGGGNSFSGGFLAGLCRFPDDPLQALQCAAASAAEIIAQPGLPSRPDEAKLRVLAQQATLNLHNKGHVKHQ